MRSTVLLAVTVMFAFGAASARADERVDGMVAALRADPVVVSTALSRSVPPADVAALRRAVADAPVPVFVVVAPSFGDEAGLETLDALPDLLHDGLGRDGIYVAVSRSNYASAQAFGVQPRFDVRDLFSAVLRDRPGVKPGEAARYAVRLLTTGERRPVARRARPGVQGLVVVVAGLGAGTIGFVVAGWPWLVLRRRKALAAASRGLAAPAEPEALRKRAREELAELSGTLAGAQAPPAAAFDAYAAASKVLDDERRPIDLVAALELVRCGRAALRGRAEAPCFFDARHGAGTERTRWRLGREETELPACRTCAEAVASGRTPVALEDRGRPYFERDTLWARTGLGALDDELPARVLAGEARG